MHLRLCMLIRLSVCLLGVSLQSLNRFEPNLGEWIPRNRCAQSVSASQ